MDTLKCGAVVLLVMVLLPSCATIADKTIRSPQQDFTGRWQAQNRGPALTLDLRRGGKCLLIESESSAEGTWSVTNGELRVVIPPTHPFDFEEFGGFFNRQGNRLAFWGQESEAMSEALLLRRVNDPRVLRTP